MTNLLETELIKWIYILVYLNISLILLYIIFKINNRR